MGNTAYRQRQLDLIKKIKAETADWDLEMDYGGLSATKIKMLKLTEIDTSSIVGTSGIQEIRASLKNKVENALEPEEKFIKILIKGKECKDFLTTDTGKILISLEKLKSVFKRKKCSVTGGNFPRIKLDRGGSRKVFLTIPMIIYLYLGVRLDVYKNAYLELLKEVMEILENAKTEDGEDLYFMEEWDKLEETIELIERDCTENGVDTETQIPANIGQTIQEKDKTGVRFLKRKEGIYISATSLANLTKKILGDGYTRSQVNATRFDFYNLDYEVFDIRGVRRKLFVKLNDKLTLNTIQANKVLQAFSKCSKIESKIFIEELKKENKEYF